MVVFSFLNPID